MSAQVKNTIGNTHQDACLKIKNNNYNNTSSNKGYKCKNNNNDLLSNFIHHASSSCPSPCYYFDARSFHLRD